MRTLQQILKKTGYKDTEMEFFLAECLVDYLYFAEHVLDFKIAEYHREWHELTEKYKRLCIIAFRGSGKTHFFAGYFLWKGIFSNSKEFLIVSNRDNQAKEVLKIIRNMIAQNEILKEFIPASREASWKATELSLTNGSIFYCKPFNENVRSWHPDYLLCDEAGEYEDKSVFWTAVLGTIQLKMGRVIVIGTPKSSIDLLMELKENAEYFCGEYPAEKDGKVLWPQKYTIEDHDIANTRSLVKIRNEIGELPYTQEYMLIPISSANSLFPFELISKGLINEKFLPYGRKDERYYIGYDLAISPKGDYTVMIVLGVNADRKRIVHAIRFRDNFDEQKRRLRRLIDDFKPVKVLIDATGLGEKQAKELSEEFAGIVIPQKITYDEKYKMFLDLRQEFERYNLIIPNSKDDETYGFAQQLLKELNDIALKIDLRIGASARPKFYSGKYDDCVMALSLANKASLNIYGDISIRLI